MSSINQTCGNHFFGPYALEKGSSALTCLSSYFALSGSIMILHSKEGNRRHLMVVDLRKMSSSVLSGIVKVISYCTVIIPLVMLVIYTITRLYYTIQPAESAAKTPGASIPGSSAANNSSNHNYQIPVTNSSRKSRSGNLTIKHAPDLPKNSNIASLKQEKIRRIDRPDREEEALSHIDFLRKKRLLDGDKWRTNYLKDSKSAFDSLLNDKEKLEKDNYNICYRVILEAFDLKMRNFSSCNLTICNDSCEARIIEIRRDDSRFNSNKYLFDGLFVDSDYLKFFVENGLIFNIEEFGNSDGKVDSVFIYC